jgi:PhoPQ-activated pathogenicity-related protein
MEDTTDRFSIIIYYLRLNGNKSINGFPYKPHVENMSMVRQSFQRLKPRLTTAKSTRYIQITKKITIIFVHLLTIVYLSHPVRRLTPERESQK